MIFKDDDYERSVKVDSDLSYYSAAVEQGKLPLVGMGRFKIFIIQ